MGTLIRAADWTRTPLGPPETWPISLRTAVGIMLSSRYAMFVWWGRELINIYNDAYRPFLGAKHPEALGRSAQDVWAEIWDLIGPRTEAVLERAESTFDEALLLVMERYGYPEETYFTFSYSPLRNDTGEVGGIFAAVTDETLRVIRERRLRLLREVATASSQADTPEQVCAAAAECIARDSRGMPFGLLYLMQPGGKAAGLVAHAGLDDPDWRGAPPLIDFEADESIWPLAQAAETGEPVVVEGLASRFNDLPKGAWDRPPDRAIVLPLKEQGQTGTAGFLIGALNPFRSFDDEYRDFVGLLANQIAAGIANARAYQEERRRAEALAEIDRAKTAFFSNVSHEFRTPLTLILGSLEDLLAKKPDDAAPEAHEAGTVAHRNALRLQMLVNSLLEFSRIEAGRIQASYEPTDLAALTAELVSNFRSACERAGLALTVDCPPFDEPVYVDRDMWEKIVLNLVSNAFKYTHAGGITVTLRRDGDGAVLSVGDTGIGISDTEIPRLFERFHRVEGARGRTHEGTGIGLALVQELVRLHGGAVAVQSALGAGSTFTVRVPFGASHLPTDRIRGERALASTAISARSYVEEALRWLPEADGAVAGADFAIERELLTDRAELPANGVEPGAERPAILLADDNADMRDYVRRLLGAQYDVRAVGDGEAALAALREASFDLVLSDVMMPGLDGFGLLRGIRADAALADIPVVLLSARAGEEASIEGLQAGADDYLVKPFSARELQARVAANMELARMRRHRRQMEEDLRAQDALTRAVLETTPECIEIIAADGELLYMNGAGLRMIGAERADQVRGTSIFDLIAPEDRNEWRANHERVCRGEPVSWQFALVGLDGTRRHMETHAAPLILPDGSTAQLAITRDITRNKEAEAALKISEERFRTLADNIPQLAWMANPDGWIFWYNQRWYEYTGTTPAEMEGWGWQSVHDPAALPQVLDRWRRSIATGQPFEMVFPLRGADGMFRPFLTRVAPIRDEHGRVVRWFGTNTDISEQRKIEDALRASERNLQHMNETLEQQVRDAVAERERVQAALFQSQKLEAIGQLTGGVAHDFNNLLTAIIGSLEILSLNRSGERSRQCIDTAMRAAERGAKLTQQLLAYARKQHMQWRPVDINRLLRDLEDMLGRTLGELVEIEMRLADDLWYARSDPTQLELAILNLAINARDAMPLGGALQIETRNAVVENGEIPELDAGEYAHLVISDTGHGMPPEVIAKAMDPFFTTKEVGKGSGLGLSQVYGVVKQCGGAIRLKSVEGRGTTVLIWLPRSA